MIADVLRQICVQAHEPVIVTDAVGQVEAINRPFSDMCGHTLDDLAGRKPGEVLQGPDTSDKTVASLRRAIARWTPVARKILNYHADGHPYWVYLQISPIRGPRNTVEHFIAFEREIDGPVETTQVQAMCMFCKSFQASHGEWSHLEAFYEKTHGRAISHGVCPQCSSKWR